MDCQYSSGFIGGPTPLPLGESHKKRRHKLFSVYSYDTAVYVEFGNIIKIL